MAVTNIKKKIVVQGDDDREHLGLVHVITGDGKGKTTSSLGLALRAVGANLRVGIVQFLKAGVTGEVFAIQKYVPSIHIIQYGVDAIRERQKTLSSFQEKTSKFVFNPDEEERDAALQGFEYAKKMITSGDYDMVILDEFNVVLKKNLIPTSEALDLMKEHGKVELIFTGRDAPQPIIDAADYCSTIFPVKHPWQKGIKARKGVEY